MKMEYAIRMPWKIMTIYILVLLGSFSTGLHLGNVSQKKSVKQITQKINTAKVHDHNGRPNTVNNLPAVSNASDQSQPPLRKLQLEILELQRMQKQLKSEMVSGADNSKKIKLLQHIKTQIQLRRMQQTRSKKHQHPILKKQSGVIVNNKDVQLHQHHQHTAKELNVAQNTKTLTELKTQPKISNTQKKTKTTHHIQKSQYQKQHEQIQELRQQKQDLEQRSQYTVQSKRKSIAPAQNSLPQNYINEPTLLETGQNLEMQYANGNAMYNSLVLQNQQLPQMQAMSPTALVQQRLPVQLNNQVGMNQGQISFMNQQATWMNKGGRQLDAAQQVLVPLNALSVNNLVPRNVLSGERFILVDTAMQDNMQFAMAGGPLIMQAEKTTTKPPTTKSSTQVQQITKPTTQQTSTTVTTKPPTTHAPTPPTTERIAYDPVPVNSDMFGQQYYNGEMQRQQLEITKLKLEIRSLRRKEIADMQMARGGGDSENEDAPPRRRNMMRFQQRGGMPFRFFK